MGDLSLSLNMLYCYNLINCHFVPTVLGLLLFSIESVLFSVESTRLCDSHYICSKQFILKNYMRWRARGLLLCVTDPQDCIKLKIFMIDRSYDCLL